MDLLHRIRETLQQLDNFGAFLLQGLLDLIVKSVGYEERRTREEEEVPRIDVHVLYSQLPDDFP